MSFLNLTDIAGLEANVSDGRIPALGTQGFHRPLSDPSTNLQVRCHGSERDGRDVPISDKRTPVRPRGSNQLSKSWPRRALAVRTSPSGWRRTERLLECAGECGLGVVTDNLGNLCDGRAGVAELLSRDLHGPVGEVVHRRHADQANEAVGQRRTR